MINQIRSLVWMDYILYLFTDFKKAGQLFARSKFLPGTLLFPVIASITDIISFYTAFELKNGLFISLSYGFISLAIFQITTSWFQSALITTAADFETDSNSILRNFSIINSAFIFKLFILPLVSLSSALSFAPGAFLILGNVVIIIVSILFVSNALAVSNQITFAKALSFILVPQILYGIIQFIFILLSMIYLFQLVGA
jgi:hypothetical protein